MKKQNKSWNSDNHYLQAVQSKWYNAIAAIQSEITFATYTFYRQKGLKSALLPITTTAVSSPSGIGSDSLPVQIELFGNKMYLVDSMQFYLEYLCRFFPQGCFYIMPSFRGETADERHLSQFMHSEAEIIGKLGDVKKLVEEYVLYLTESILNNCAQQVLDVTDSVAHLEKLAKNRQFANVSYTEAVKILTQRGENGSIKLIDGYHSITAIGEKQLMSLLGDFLWVNYMDKMLVPFYQNVNEECPSLANCADLLFGIGEVVGCGERFSQGEKVRQSLALHKVDAQAYSWYLNMKDKYPLQTAGFGMGIERFLLWVVKGDDIRDIQLIPRFNGQKFIF